MVPSPAGAACTTATPCADVPTALGTLGGTSSYGYGISGDGSVAVGYSFTSGATNPHAYRWTSSGGLADLGTLGGTLSFGLGVSDDGSVVVGLSRLAGDATYHAYRWTGGAMTDLGTLGGSNSTAYSANGDGSVVVGNSDLAGDVIRRAFRWTSGGGMVDLGTLGGTYSRADDVNTDGSVVVGSAATAGDAAGHAFRWTNAGGMIDLGTLGGTYSAARGVNGDGTVVVGEANISGDSAYHAFRWTDAGGMSDLGTLGGDDSYGKSVSADGNVVVGYSEIVPGDNATKAFRWTSDTGLMDLNVLLANAGVSMAGISLDSASAVSANGQFITGTGVFSGAGNAYVVRYDDGIAGLTTSESVQSSVNELADSRRGVMAQHQGLVAPLLGTDKPMTLTNEAGVFASAGSASVGGFAQLSSDKGLSVLGGISYAREDYEHAEMSDAVSAALALRYLQPGNGAWRPFVEGGGWIAPNASMDFTRTYANGTGTATGSGSTDGDLSYLYARAGLLFASSMSDQLVASAEVGRERMQVEAYSEQVSAQNPFEAQVSEGTDVMDIARLRLQWSHAFTSVFDSTVWVAGVRDFNSTSGLVATVPGFGTLTPTDQDNASWLEYGARLGYKLSDAVTVDVFANGISGSDGIDTRVHGGADVRFRF